VASLKHSHSKVYTLCDITGMQSTTKHIVVPEGLQPFSRHYWQKQTNLLMAIHKINHPPFVVYEMCYIHTWDDLSRSHMVSDRDLDEHPSWEWVKNQKIPSLLGKLRVQPWTSFISSIFSLIFQAKVIARVVMLIYQRVYLGLYPLVI
jgi:hypothetical protein